MMVMVIVTVMKDSAAFSVTRRNFQLVMEWKDRMEGLSGGNGGEEGVWF